MDGMFMLFVLLLFFKDNPHPHEKESLALGKKLILVVVVADEILVASPNYIGGQKQPGLIGFLAKLSVTSIGSIANPEKSAILY
ncbi:hypothetical protein HanXRQr2_Chr05g0201351 [Helianthus annuus]|uniref:Uncharacterized protein n=1 Tax=Helianthus annuus TaxID=4232 RepID=A0A9K3IY51_HELAN|nr:hypothetical protein HanXRQr2_Chr05g0201351 [Helianthus annuus]KAJ0921665.1 hypothetical protein HanPSC8_Chr05g0194241 [Helianthus annuus]